MTYELNDFSDLTEEEWKKYLMTPKPDHSEKSLKPKTLIDKKNLPNSVDWRNVNGTNHVTGIKYQGPCGSCWAFATAAAIESAVSISGGGLQSLSSQQVCLDSKRRINLSDEIDLTSFNIITLEQNILKF